ncbi:MAG: YggS family pyridoxal phosphate-dependent enzyme [Tepidimonas sp.]|uniref:YggS family pyridoxal phosphate-dependent enzyme n=1 Tax=Tepidimonas sp. TaxID=2002775 RepID=UPI00298EE01F|nr:YggS family pyridoxal phosphate-dependent enzyme [Tepidimonas sp.]MCS6810475.1 YggS family pyridoxal phosphate-dependent enzyme [Tepidimonas sp.]MDW8337273.1 YggS family pyridoxal phosphate-dependent enzyme [Tepidimonas sp.]
MATIADNLQAVRARIEAACAACGRAPGSVQLLAVSKTFGPQAVAEAVAAGQRAFGENYVQEGAEKIAALREAGVAGLQWHCIGPLQSNKTRLVAEHFDWVQSVDRLKIAQRLNEQRPAHLEPLQVCLQVNIDGAPTKAGVAPQEAGALAQAVAALPRLRLRGLMCIPDPQPEPAAMRRVLAQAARLFHELRAQLGAPPDFDTLSMGMSEDLELAIAEGSTMVRVGSAIFGRRTYAADTAA